MNDNSVVVNAFEKAVEGILDQAAATVLAKMKLEQLKAEREMEKLTDRNNTQRPQKELPPKSRKRNKPVVLEDTSFDSDKLDLFNEID